MSMQGTSAGANAGHSSNPFVMMLELNEVNFDYVQRYHKKGELDTLGRLVQDHGLTETFVAEDLKEDEVQPWIQWPTLHSGVPYSEHQIYEQGNAAFSDLTQIWERLEQKYGACVGAISPMNARNNTEHSPFFVPDPWTPTPVSGSGTLRRLSCALSQVVNDSAAGRISKKSAVALLEAFVRYVPATQWVRFVNMARRAKKHKTYKAMFLDQLLAEIYFTLVRAHRPNFSTLFLNGVAHLQHHFIRNAEVGDVQDKNPDWYVDSNFDPVLEGYRAYDAIVARLLRLFPTAHLLITTGISGVPHKEWGNFCYRLKSPASLLDQLGIAYKEIRPHMSTTFVVVCERDDQVETAIDLLGSATDQEGDALLVANASDRGNELILTNGCCKEMKPGTVARFKNGHTIDRFEEFVSFTAITNGTHSETGYLIDTQQSSATAPSTISLREVCHVLEADFLEQPSINVQRRAA